MPRKTRSTRRSRSRRSTVGGGFFDFLVGSSEEKKNVSANVSTNVSMPVNTGVSANVQASVGGKRKSRKARKSRNARKASRKH